jgi:hypothetical protein
MTAEVDEMHSWDCSEISLGERGRIRVTTRTFWEGAVLARIDVMEARGAVAGRSMVTS